jgi:hypothetical protein
MHEVKTGRVFFYQYFSISISISFSLNHVICVLLSKRKELEGDDLNSSA